MEIIFYDGEAVIGKVRDKRLDDLMELKQHPRYPERYVKLFFDHSVSGFLHKCEHFCRIVSSSSKVSLLEHI